MRYGVALLSVVVGIANIEGLQSPAPVASLVLAVIVSVWFGGRGPGIAATLLSIPALFFYLPPEGWAMDAAQVHRLASFLLIASFILWVMESERRSAASLRLVRDELQRRNEILTEENIQGKTLEQDLRHIEHELRLVIDTIPTMAWILRADGATEFLNRRWLDYTGLTLEEAVGRPTSTLHPEDAGSALERWSEAMSLGRSYTDELRLRGADGRYRWFLVRNVPLRDESDRIVRWYGTSTDIEDRKRAEREAREFAERLQQLSHRLLEVQEEERRNLARELHDEFAQLLATIKLHLHAAKASSQPAVQARLEECIALLQTASEQMRSLALELRPTMLETVGLEGALRWLARQNQQRTGIETALVGHVGDVKGKVATVCFRIAQQALTNVVQHAAARCVWIEATRDAGELKLVVLDDGAGFDVARTLMHADARGHLGLLGMRERAEILGGNLRVDSEPGLGTRIVVAVPLAGESTRLSEDAA